MRTDELRAILGEDLKEARDTARSISSHVMWRVDSAETLVAVGGDRAPATQLNALLDGLHLWLNEAGQTGRLRYVLGSDSDRPQRTEAVLQAARTLRAVIRDRCDLSIQVDGGDVDDASPPDFTAAKPEWLSGLRSRDRLLGDPPQLARQLLELVDDESFYWNATVTARELTGRVDGLIVCKLNATASEGVLEIGRHRGQGQEDRAARRVFRGLADGRTSVPFASSNVDEAARIIRGIVQSRRSGELAGIEREHLLEARVLRGAVVVRVEDGPTLQPALRSGQFPAIWASSGRARYLDALMRDDGDPWAVELKIESGGRGKYYRHAIGQVVLYREFIRQAGALHPWFTEREPPLTAARCQAAVAFPGLIGQAQGRREAIKGLADLFDVQVIELGAIGKAGSELKRS